MKKSKWYFINLYRALSVAQWCVLVCAILTFITGPEQLWLSIVEIVLFLVLLILHFKYSPVSESIRYMPERFPLSLHKYPSIMGSASYSTVASAVGTT